MDDHMKMTKFKVEWITNKHQLAMVLKISNYSFNNLFMLDPQLGWDPGSDTPAIFRMLIYEILGHLLDFFDCYRSTTPS